MTKRDYKRIKKDYKGLADFTICYKLLKKLINAAYSHAKLWVERRGLCGSNAVDGGSNPLCYGLNAVSVWVERRYFNNVNKN